MQHEKILVRLSSHENILIPVGLACLQAYLKQHGINVKIADYKGDYLLGRFMVNHFVVSFVSNTIPCHQDIPSALSMVEDIIEGKEIDLTNDFYQQLFFDYSLRLYRSVASCVEQCRQKIDFASTIAHELAGAKIVGVSIDYTNLTESALFAAFLKKINPQIQIIWGGPAVSQSHDALALFLQLKIVDGLVIGEGEETIRQIFLHFDQGLSWQHLAGIRTEGKQKIVPPKALNLDELPTPDFTGIDLTQYNNRACVYTSRGCTNKCSFCGEWNLFGGKFRMRSPAKVVDDIQKILAQYKPQRILFADSLINPSKEYINELCDLIIAKKIKTAFMAQIRAEITSELALKMAKAGFARLGVGVESLDNFELGVMNKRRTVNDSLLAIDNIIQARIPVYATLIIGYAPTLEDEFRNYQAIIKTIQMYGKEFWEGRLLSGQNLSNFVNWHVSFSALMPGSIDFKCARPEINYKPWRPLISLNDDPRIRHLMKLVDKIPYEHIRPIPNDVIMAMIQGIKDTAAMYDDSSANNFYDCY